MVRQVIQESHSRVKQALDRIMFFLVKVTWKLAWGLANKKECLVKNQLFKQNSKYFACSTKITAILWMKLSGSSIQGKMKEWHFIKNITPLTIKALVRLQFIIYKALLLPSMKFINTDKNVYIFMHVHLKQ